MKEDLPQDNDHGYGYGGISHIEDWPAVKLDYRGNVDIKEIDVQKIQNLAKSEPVNEVAKSPA